MERAHVYQDIPDKDTFMKDYKGPKPVRDAKFKEAVKSARDYNKRIDAAVARARKYKCPCGHKGNGEFNPPFKVKFEPSVRVSEYTLKLQAEREAKLDAEKRAKRLEAEAKAKKEEGGEEDEEGEDDEEKGEKEGKGEIGRAVQQECRDRSRMPSSA
eukprot:TRINITY_DN9650_c0_g1_i1.p1 TRINITY_DN9650_c0_g1~~TRINITY_DN9650_c0_g1_i1.p1  ORF type:complete len:157 (-),score=41.91 TRINITY_DN9650_c0_g1_i1:11-481(-)